MPRSVDALEETAFCGYDHACEPGWLLRCGYDKVLQICGPVLYPSQEACLEMAEGQTEKYAFKHAEYDCIPAVSAPPHVTEQQ